MSHTHLIKNAEMAVADLYDASPYEALMFVLTTLKLLINKQEAK